MQKPSPSMAPVLAKARSLALLACALILFLIGIYTYTRVSTPKRVYAATSSSINFQGRLLTSAGNVVPDGYYNIEFKLYSASSGGSTLWTDTRYDQNGATAGLDYRLRVVNGYFSVALGDTSAGGTAFPGTINWDQEHWLTMNVGGSTQTVTPTWDGEMTPRLKLTAVPFAFRSIRADTLTNGSGTLAADDILQKAPSTIQSVSSTVAGLRIDQVGSGGLLQLRGDGVDVFTVAKTGNTYLKGTLDIDGATLDIGTTAQSGALVLSDGSSNTLTLQTGSQSGDLTFTLPTAYGANGECLKGNGGGTLSFDACGGADSFVDGGNAFGNLATLGTTDSNELQFITANTQAIRIDTSGNVRIGSSGAPAEKLDVNGGLRIGNTTNSNAGTIRWNGADFQGFDGASWVSLTASGGVSPGNSNSMSSFTSGLANVAATANAQVAETLLFTSATAVSNTAGVTGFTAPAAGSFRTCLVKNTANITGGTLRLRWRVNGVSVGANACTMDNTAAKQRQSATSLDPNVVTFAAGDTIGIAFDTTSLAPTTNDFTVFWSVEYNSSALTGVTLQTAYNNSLTPAILTLANAKDLKIALPDTATDSNFLVDITNGATGKFAIQASGTDSFSVTTSAVNINKAITATAGLNLSSSGITNAGSITGVGTNITAAAGLTIASGGSGALTLDSASNTIVIGATDTGLQRVAAGNYTIDLNSGSATGLVLNNSGAGAASLNLTDGALQTAGTTRLTNGGALQNISGLAFTGSATMSGNVTIGSASTERLTFTSQILGSSALVFQGATDNAFSTTLSVIDPTANNTITLPNGSGGLVLDTRSITTAAGSGLSGGGNLTTDRSLSLDINGLTANASVNMSDYLAIYDGSGVKKISRSDFLQGIIGALQYRGTWNASTNTPALSDGTGAAGDEYAVSVAGTQDLGSGNISFGVGDFAIHNGTKWERAPSSSLVTSVFGRTGAITAQNGDYTGLQITNTAAGNISATTVQAALNELDNEKLGSLNGLTANSQTFANDTNVTISSSGSTHTLGWSGQLAVGRGGTGAGSFTSNGLLYGNGTGALQVTAAGTGGQVLLANGSGVPTFTTLSGDLTIDSSGAVTVGSNTVTLGTDTVGNYVASLGTLTGLSTTGNSGEGSTPTISVLYGASSNTAVEGDTTIVCPSGAGNLIGGGDTITLGSGGTCSNLSTADAVTFNTSVTTPILTSGAGLDISSSNGGDITLNSDSDNIIVDDASITGSGALSLQSAAATNLTLDSGTTGAVNIGTGANAKTIQIGTTTGAVAQTINIGNNATASSSSTVVVGSMVGTSPVTLQSGTDGVLVKGATSATAFQVHDPFGTSLFVADTSAMKVGILATTKTGLLTIGTNTTSTTGGIYFGTDTNLYRNNVNELKTGSYFYSAALVGAEHGGAAQTLIGAVGPSSESGIKLGSAGDTSLYRDAAGNTLKTDDAFIVAGLLTGQLGATLSGATINLNASSNFATNINTGNSTGAITIGNTTAGAFTLQGGATGVLVKGADSTTGFQIQKSDTTALLTADTSGMIVKVATTAAATQAGTDLLVADAEFSSAVRVGDGTNRAQFDGTSKELSFVGTARHAKKIELDPEYPGATFTPDGSNNTGTLNSDFCSGSSRLNLNTTFCAATDNHNYYSWTSSSGTNDYDIYIRYTIPSDYSGDPTFSMFGWRTTSSSSVAITLLKDDGTTCISSTNTATGTAVWTDTSLTNSCSFAADDRVIIRIRLTAAVSEYALAGKITFNYRSRW